MIPLTKEEKNYIVSKNYVIYAKKHLGLMVRKFQKVRYHCHYTGTYRGIVCNLRYKTPKEISAVFHNGSTYSYHFIIKDLVEKFEGQFDCLGENTEKYITFSVPIKEELDNGKAITYKIKCIDSIRFVSSSLSSLVDNVSEEFHNFITISVQIVNLALIIYQLKVIN